MNVYLVVYDRERHVPESDDDHPEHGVVIERVKVPRSVTEDERQVFCDSFNAMELDVGVGVWAILTGRTDLTVGQRIRIRDAESAPKHLHRFSIN